MTLVTCFRDMLFETKSRGLFKQAGRGSDRKIHNQTWVLLAEMAAETAAEAAAVAADAAAEGLVIQDSGSVAVVTRFCLNRF